MNLEAQRRNIVHKILDIENVQLLDKIEALLNNDIYTFTTDGKALTTKDYKEHLQQIMNVSDAGESGYTTEEARKKIIKK
ncbi:hypothetical protein [Flavobacterium sp. UMI-01]|uniref:hypothetical protein n=1 Tax=Flavobacterium sp. UMI-01 TaxID=1441053 RepID=UPI001C7CCCBA|nr:hypothetical protein [Flavobacterium sp. UMI-01]GIZ09131.1 hypothetical protein FUMI01_18580 [Flavobacterium sp. UMI-01]